MMNVINNTYHTNSSNVAFSSKMQLPNRFSVSENDIFENSDVKYREFNKSLENSLLNVDIDYSSFKKNGIPLKYPRKNFIEDSMKFLSNCDEKEKKNICKKFNITPTFCKEQNRTEFSDILKLPKNTNTLTQPEKNMYKIVSKYLLNNKVMLKNNATNKFLGDLFNEVPELVSTVGKPQHLTHDYSVDIHTLEVLKKSNDYIKKTPISEKSKFVLNMTAILHDIGKRYINDDTPDEGHAKLSAEISKKILKRFDLTPEINDRILNQIENHHWFKNYNCGITSREDVRDIFKSDDDMKIAFALAKADFASVNNRMHLNRKRNNYHMENPARLMSNEEYNDFMNDVYINLL